MLKQLFGDPNTRKLKKFQPLVADVNAIEEDIAALSDDELRGKTAEFQEQLAKADSDREEQDILDDILPEAFAVVREAGRTLANAVAEVQEAADFLRYYAAEARRTLSTPLTLPGPTGEHNALDWRARGVVACISPWNFPLAIFTGQIAAALAAGNTVIAKPAPQTAITATLATQLLHEAGVPGDALHLLPGDGRVGATLVRDVRVSAVQFTGSTATASIIARTLADRRGPIIPFIAETGGVNCMIADSSALPEQVVRDCVRSAFDSAGQRCSAARVLFVHADTANRVIPMLSGAIEALDLGDPLDAATDVGPVIDPAAQDALDARKIGLQRAGKTLIDKVLPEACRAGTYVTPAAYEITALNPAEPEIFGPILQVIRYSRGGLPKVVEAINATGSGLTLGLHSRLQSVADYVAEHAKVGNLYVNRSQIGARVGAQPFGGEGLSGTGPKAGGPHLLTRLMTNVSARPTSPQPAAIGNCWAAAEPSAGTTAEIATIPACRCKLTAVQTGLPTMTPHIWPYSQSFLKKYHRHLIPVSRR
ncbi:MAG: L-glutamate gamma-semialdehyde dehydrogenase [Verrucomicrobiae bacterium]|nr:L-glutamate gamma-semialdehyde dehydrogenase [Verrucomicrobiae bacterium]